MILTTAELFRVVAAFYEEHPDLPFPSVYSWGSVTVVLNRENAKECLRSIGAFKKEYSGAYFTAKKEIDGVEFCFLVNREAVCRKVVTGTKRVEAYMEPAKLIEAHDVEVVEWECDEPILTETILSKEDTYGPYPI